MKAVLVVCVALLLTVQYTEASGLQDVIDAFKTQLEELKETINKIVDSIKDTSGKCKEELEKLLKDAVNYLKEDTAATVQCIKGFPQVSECLKERLEVLKEHCKAVKQDFEDLKQCLLH